MDGTCRSGVALVWFSSLGFPQLEDQNHVPLVWTPNLQS